MQHEENGCEKVLWPCLETNKGSRLHKNSGIHKQNPTGKNYSCEYIFCEEKQKAGLYVYYLESLRVPLVVRVPQFGNHWFRTYIKTCK